MRLYHLVSKECGHDEFFEFSVYAKSHQEAFNLAKKYAKYYKDDYDFNGDISNWKVKEVTLDKPKVIQSSILYG